MMYIYLVIRRASCLGLQACAGPYEKKTTHVACRPGRASVRERRTIIQGAGQPNHGCTHWIQLDIQLAMARKALILNFLRLENHLE